jgi:phytanoyl-CoA hydroxylase
MTVGYTDTEDLEQVFQRQGYALVRNLLSVDIDMGQMFAEYSAKLDSLAEIWLAQSVITTYDKSQSLFEKCRIVEQQAHGYCQEHFDISLNPFTRDPPQFILQPPIHTGEGVFRILTNNKLLDNLEQLIGSEITCAPIQHLRIKPTESRLPAEARNVLTAQSFWHQDMGVLTSEADNSDMISVFVALTDITDSSGCVVVVPESHKLGLLHHCRTPKANGIPPQLVSGKQETIRMSAGDVLFLHRLTVHGSLPNESPWARWSLDLRYVPTGQPTGRSFFPEFVARSRKNPASALTSGEEWSARWQDAQQRLAGQHAPAYTRWNPHNLTYCRHCTDTGKAGLSNA